ncbi:MAG: elongation factor G [Thermodesulfobacteriota bacterium]|nr:elongation factor G [Thermodesulfobacteriota bacterium]
MTEKMKSLRNIALVGHASAGKTTISEATLFNAKAIERLGKVEDGNTAMDFEPEEVKRMSSISSGFYQYEWQKKTINLIDTPGDQNFFSDAVSCMQAADGVVLVIDSVDGIKVQTEEAWEFAGKHNIPAAIFINKLDKERADFNQAFEDAKEALGDPKPILIQLPIGEKEDFKGVVDLVDMKAYTYDENGKRSAIDIPADMQDQVESEKEALIENIAEADDSLLERYLEGETLTDEELNGALKKGIVSRTFAPVLCGAATANIGIDLLSDFIADCMPSPDERGPWQAKDMDGNEVTCNPDPAEPFAAFVFKTVADPFSGRLSLFRVVSGSLGSDGNFFNATQDTTEKYNQMLTMAGKKQKNTGEAVPGSIVAVAKLKATKTGDTLCNDSRKLVFECEEPLPSVMSFAVEPKNKGDEDKLQSSLTRLTEEDPALVLSRDSEAKAIILSGRGQIHIETAVERLKRKFNVEVNLSTPRIPYRETISKKVRVQGRHKKQSGGHGQFGDCWVQFEPRERGEGFEFVDQIVGGAIPRTYIPAVEKGIIEASNKGPLAGFPCIDFRATLDDGSYHSVDSSEMAFKIAGSLAFKKAAVDAGPVILEPIMEITVTTPEDFMGDVMGDLNSKRGRVLGMESKGRNQVVKAHVPMAEFQTYDPDLRSMTGGRGKFTLEFSHYEVMPTQEAEKVIEAANRENE